MRARSPRRPTEPWPRPTSLSSMQAGNFGIVANSTTPRTRKASGNTSCGMSSTPLRPARIPRWRSFRPWDAQSSGRPATGTDSGSVLRLPGAGASLRGGGAPLAKLSETPFKEREDGRQVSISLIRLADPCGLTGFLLELSHEFLDVGNGPGQLIHDRDRRPLGGSGKRVQVDTDDDLAHPREGFGPIAILERDQDHIRSVDPIPMRQGPFRFEAWNPGVGTDAEDIARSGSLEYPYDPSHADFRSMEETHLDSGRNGLGEPHHFARGERGHVPVHGDHGT